MKVNGNLPSLNDMLAIVEINGAKISAQDLRIEVGTTSNGDDLAGILSISFLTSAVLLSCNDAIGLNADLVLSGNSIGLTVSRASAMAV